MFSRFNIHLCSKIVLCYCYYRSVNTKAGIDMVFITSKLAVLTVPQDVNCESLASFLDSRLCRLYNMTGQSYPRTIGRTTVYTTLLRLYY